MKKIISLCLVFAFCLLTLTSCGNEIWLIKYDGEEISPDIYSYYVYSAYEMLEYYDYIDASKPIDEQTVTDVDENGKRVEYPAEEYINDYALDELLFLCELKRRFENEGLEFDESTASSIQVSANTEFASYETIFENNGITADTVKQGSNSGELGAMRQQLFKHLYQEGGSREVTSEELTKFYQDKYVSYSYIYKALVDSDGVALDDAGKAAVKSELEGIKAKVESGEENIDTYAKEYAQEYAGDKSCGKNGVSSTTSQKSNTTLMNELADMANEEVRYVEMNNYAFLLKKHDIMSNGYFDSEDNKYNILVSMKFDDFIQGITDASKNADYELNEKALEKYGIEKFNFDGLEVNSSL